MVSLLPIPNQFVILLALGVLTFGLFGFCISLTSAPRSTTSTWPSLLKPLALHTFEVFSTRSIQYLLLATMDQTSSHWSTETLSRLPSRWQKRCCCCFIFERWPIWNHEDENFRETSDCCVGTMWMVVAANQTHFSQLEWLSSWTSNKPSFSSKSL